MRFLSIQFAENSKLSFIDFFWVYSNSCYESYTSTEMYYGNKCDRIYRDFRVFRLPNCYILRIYSILWYFPLDITDGIAMILISYLLLQFLLSISLLHQGLVALKPMLRHFLLNYVQIEITGCAETKGARIHMEIR